MQALVVNSDQRTFQALPPPRPAPTCGKLVVGVVLALSPATRQIVSNVTGVLVQAAHPKRIILFGSRARGEAASDSDFDIMVVEEIPANRFAEIVRLNRLLRSFDMAIDLLVVSDENFQYWRDTPGNVYYEAATWAAETTCCLLQQTTITTVGNRAREGTHRAVRCRVSESARSPDREDGLPVASTGVQTASC